jgi:TRAP-type mannitol/chloroaromatic compound transport system substrate-binding protein
MYAPVTLPSLFVKAAMLMAKLLVGHIIVESRKLIVLSRKRYGQFWMGTHMERRKFIGTAGLAGILAAGMAPAAHANQAIRWRLASRLPKIMDIPYAGVQTFIRTAKELSGGKFEITLQIADEATAGTGILDSVQRGSVECGHTSAAYYVGKDETFALDSAIPFGLNAHQMTAWMQHGDGLALLREFYKGHGIVNFPLGNTSAQMGGWYRKPIRSPADLKGLRMRIGGLGGRVFERLGGRASSQSSDETLKALERGNLDAAEWSSPHDDLRLGLHDLCQYYAHPGWWKGGMQYSLYVNHRAYDALTDENQAIVEAAAAVAHLDIQAQYDARNPLALAELVATGTQLMPLPKPVLDAAWKAAQELYAELAGKNPQWKKIYGSYAAFLKTQAWNQAETGFDSFMHAQLMKTVQIIRKPKKSALTGRRQPS